MKNVIIGMVLIFLIIISMSIILTVDGRSIRSNEVEKSLTSAIDNSVENLMAKKIYSINNNNELITDLIESLLVQIESTSTIKINILDIDTSKGLLSIEVIEQYTHPNGKTGTVSCVKTVIFEQDIDSSVVEANKQVKITFLVPSNGTNVIYKEYNVKKGSEIIVPQNPTISGKTFLQWTLNGSKYALSDVDRNKIKVNDDISLLAEFN